MIFCHTDCLEHMPFEESSARSECCENAVGNPVRADIRHAIWP